MVKRVLFSTIVGAFIYLFFGMISWTVLPYHKQTLNEFSKEDVVVAALKEAAPTSGIYVSPKFGDKSATTVTDSATTTPDVAVEQAKSLIFVSVNTEGQDPSMRTQILHSALVDLVGAFLISLLLLYAARDSYISRWFFVVLVGAIVGLLGEAPYNVWWGFDQMFVLNNMLDSVVGWGLAGLFMAAIIKKKEA